MFNIVLLDLTMDHVLTPTSQGGAADALCSPGMLHMLRARHLMSGVGDFRPTSALRAALRFLNLALKVIMVAAVSIMMRLIMSPLLLVGSRRPVHSTLPIQVLLRPILRR